MLEGLKLAHHNVHKGSATHPRAFGVSVHRHIAPPIQSYDGLRGARDTDEGRDGAVISIKPEDKSMATQPTGIRVFDPHDRFHRFDSALGPITLAASDTGLRGLWFEGQHYFPNLPDRPFSPRDSVLRKAEQQLREYFAGQRKTFDLPLDFSRGTPFQRSIWTALTRQPFGVTTTYSTLASQIGRANAVRAVGAAIGRNPISVIVPCHRVLGSDGSLTGYAGGLERKIALLRIEALALADQPIDTRRAGDQLRRTL